MCRSFKWEHLDTIFGFLYIVYQPRKGYWNQDKKKYVYNVMKATLYKNKKCAVGKRPKSELLTVRIG